MADFLPLLVNGHFLPRALAPVPPPPGSGASLHVHQLPYLPPRDLGPAGIFPALSPYSRG